MSESDVDTEEIAERLHSAGHRIDPVLEELFPPDEKKYLHDPFWHHMSGGGKRLRPALCLLSCEALGGDSERALPFAAAVEILHNMFLVHDDIEDGDTMRRDQPAVWTEYGIDNGVNVGDYMLGRAYRAVLNTRADDETRLRLVDHFVETFELTCEGQAFDLNRRADRSLTVDDYLEMVTRKTGHYLALGMVGGAIIGGATDEAVETFQELGCHLGPAFQIRDDVLDLQEAKGRGGETGNDIREGKPSILFAHAVNHCSPERADELVGILATPREETTDEHVSRAVDIYRSCGAFEFARETAEKYTERGFEAVERIPTDDREFFRRVVSYMVERSS
ncbi:MAG: polyprenyl synthetase family protein [Planctomycetota bacterium]